LYAITCSENSSRAPVSPRLRKRLWLSRLKPDDPRLTTQVEVEHARWIQGNAWEALLAVIVVGRDQDDLFGATREAMTDCEVVRWSL